MADIVQPDIALKDLEERWGVARNTLKNWANKLRIEIKIQPPDQPSGLVSSSIWAISSMTG